MILINTKTNKAYSNVSKVYAADKIGVSVSTIHRWSKLRDVEIYNNFILYFSEIRIKQNKGYAMR